MVTCGRRLSGFSASFTLSLDKLTIITNNTGFLFLADETVTISGRYKATENTSKEREPRTCHQTGHLRSGQLVVRPTSPLAPSPTSVSASLVSCLSTAAPVPRLFLPLVSWTKEAIVGPQQSQVFILLLKYFFWYFELVFVFFKGQVLENGQYTHQNSIYTFQVHYNYFLTYTKLFITNNNYTYTVIYRYHCNVIIH